MNLCVNARDAMPEGGTLSIKARSVELSEEEAQRNIDAETGPYVCVRVQDTGTGMPADVADKIFEPFFSTKEEGEGTGLGLSTAYSIIQSHDGFIDVASKQGAGTTFWVYLPVSEAPEEPRSGSDASVPASAGNGEQVLVVDDEEFVLETTRQALRDGGYRVLVAEGGDEALRQVEEHDGEVDAVITDLRMPNMDGLDLIRSLHARHPNLPIIAASGMADGRSENALQAGACTFLAKPFSEEELQRALQEALRAGGKASAQ